jgi:hypothetical protein
MEEKSAHFWIFMKMQEVRIKLATPPMTVANDTGNVAMGLAERGCREKG